MTTTAQLRNRYARDAISTASPARLLVMLYDRLLKDLVTAERAVGVRDIQGAHDAIMHAQEIISELHATLDTTTWREGESLKQLYLWSIEELVRANMTKHVLHVRNVREVIEPLADAWRQIASTNAGAS